MATQADTLYRPVTLSWFAIVAAVSDGPKGFNFGNLLLHIAVSVARLGLLLALLSGFRHATPVAFFATLLAAVHGMSAEAVVGMVGAAELLCSLFMTLSWWSFTVGQDGKGPRQGRVLLATAALCWGLALLSKETAVFFPIVLFAQGWMRASRIESRTAPGRAVATAAMWMIPFAGAAAIWLGCRNAVLGGIASFDGASVYEGFSTAERLGSSFGRHLGGLLEGPVLALRPDADDHASRPAAPASFGEPAVLAGVVVWVLLVPGWSSGSELAVAPRCWRCFAS